MLLKTSSSHLFDIRSISLAEFIKRDAEKVFNNSALHFVIVPRSIMSAE